MVSLTMMARLLEALSPDTRLILVGDPDQLASVEAGAVLADLVAGLTAGAPAVDGSTLPGSTLPGSTLPGSTLPGSTGAGPTGPGPTGLGPKVPNGPTS